TDNPAIAALGLLLLLAVVGLATANALGVAIVLAVLVTPALARVVYFSLSRNANNKRPLTLGENVAFFFSSLGIVTMIGVASFAAFFASCFVVCWGGITVSPGPGPNYNTLLYASVAGGLIPGILVFGLLLRKTWPKRN